MKMKKVLATTLACAAVAAVGAGGTLAYLTDSTTEVKNQFTVGKVEIKTVDEYEEPDEPLVPNEQYDKVVSVENTGETDAVVFAKVAVPMEEVTLVSDDGTKSEKKLQDIVYLQQKDDAITLEDDHLSADWTLVEDSVDQSGKVHTYIYGYKKTLEQGKTATNLFEKFQVKNVMENELSTAENAYSVNITTYAIQAANIIHASGADHVVNTADGISLDEMTYIYNVIMNQMS